MVRGRRLKESTVPFPRSAILTVILSVPSNPLDVLVSVVDWRSTDITELGTPARSSACSGVVVGWGIGTGLVEDDVTVAAAC